MSSSDTIQRSILPIPDVKQVGVTAYDAKDSDAAFPPIVPLRWVQIDLEKDGHDHLISPEERFQIAMARQ